MGIEDYPRGSRRSHAIGALLGSGVLGALAALAVRVRSPEVPGSWGLCPWLLITGAPCPTCGGLRALNRLTHLDLPAALTMNAYLTLSALVAVGVWLAAAVALGSGRWPPLRAGLVGTELRDSPGASRQLWPPSSRTLAWTFAAWAIGLLAFGGLRLIPALPIPAMRVLALSIPALLVPTP